MIVHTGALVQVLADLGTAYANATDVGYTLRNPDGTTAPSPAQPRTITDIRNVGGGFFSTTLSFVQPWQGTIEWDAPPDAFAVEEINVVGDYVPAEGPRRTTADALRSLKRYAALALGSEWEVRLWDEPGNFAFPFARVAKVGPTLMTGPAIHTDVVQPFAIHCYPPAQERLEVAVLRAEVVEEKLYTGFRIGVSEGRPMRVPLYDYTLVPETGAGAVAISRYPHDYLRVDDLSINRLHDPTDERLISVVADVRCSWRRSGRVPTGTKLVQEVLVQHVEAQVSGQ